MSTIPDPSQGLQIAVVGGGAAGFFAAVNIAEKNPATRITIYEAAAKPLQKVFISGGGRCNVTHHCFEPRRLAEYYPRGQRELLSLFSRFQPRDTMRWFERHGLRLKVEDDGRVFPVSDNSQDVIDTLLAVAAKHRVRLRTKTRVEAIEATYNGFTITAGGRSERYSHCILSTGYSPPGWKLAASLGHKVLPPVPSLFPFTVKSPVIDGLQGIALSHIKGRLTVPTEGKPQRFEAEGPVLITHTGLSGPVVYRLSAWGAKALADNRYHAQLTLDLLPELSDEELRQQLEILFLKEDAKKKLSNVHCSLFPQRLWLALLEASGAAFEERAELIGKKTMNRLVEVIKRLSLPVSGKSPSKEEFVSCGGVDLKEVDFRTMQSRLVPGLFFGGEILNIDGLTGGFNFQACWSEGWVISETLKG